MIIWDNLSTQSLKILIFVRSPLLYLKKISLFSLTPASFIADADSFSLNIICSEFLFELLIPVVKYTTFTSPPFFMVWIIIPPVPIVSSSGCGAKTITEELLVSS